MVNLRRTVHAFGDLSFLSYNFTIGGFLMKFTGNTFSQVLTLAHVHVSS